MDPLVPPKHWPPPEMPPPSEDEMRWSRWPIVGLIPRWFYRSRRYSHHTWKILEPIQQEIVSQLVTRKGSFDWPSKHHAALAKMISEAIGSEKSITPPPILPQDLFSLLFWGAYDDWTPLKFKIAFSDKFGVEISEPEFLQFHQKGLTVGEFIDHCVERIEHRVRK